MGKGKKGEQIFNADNDAVHETMALIQKEGMKPTKEEIDAMEAGGAGRGAEPTIKAPEAAAPAAPKAEAAGATMMLVVAFMFFAADIGKNVVESNINNGFGKRLNTNFVMFVLSFVNLLLAVLLTYVRQGKEGMAKLIDIEKIQNFSLPAVFFALQGSLMQLAGVFLTSGSMKKVLGQMRIPMTMVFSGMIMGATFTGLQKLAVGMILSSVWMFIVVVGGGNTVIGDAVKDPDFMVGFAVMVLANLAAVFGTLVSEKFLKKGAKTSFYIQMFHIQCTQVVISFCMYLFITPFVIGYIFGKGLEAMDKKAVAWNTWNGQNPFALKSNLMMATTGYPFGDLLAKHGDTSGEIKKIKLQTTNYEKLRSELLEKVMDSTTGFFEAKDTVKVEESDNAWIEAVKIAVEENKCDNTEAMEGADLKKYIDADANKLYTSAKEMKSAVRAALIDKQLKVEFPNQGVGKQDKIVVPALSKKEVCLAKIFGLVTGAEQAELTWEGPMEPSSSLSVKVFGTLYLQSLSQLSKMRSTDEKFMTTYPFIRKTVTQQDAALKSNFVLSTSEYFSDEKAIYGKGLHGAVFTKEKGCKDEECVFETAELVATDKSKTKFTLQAGRKVDGKFQQGDFIFVKKGDAVMELMKCENDKEATDNGWTNFVKYNNRVNTFLKTCTLLADLEAGQIPKLVSVAQQPGKYGAGTVNAKEGTMVCDYRCHNAVQSDYAAFGWWTNFNQKLVSDYDGDLNDKEKMKTVDASRFAYIPSWKIAGNFAPFSNFPAVGMFDTWLLWVSASANIIATWMSALVTKVLSSLHKQIISAVCLAAINGLEYCFIWGPSQRNKIHSDNFLFAVSGVILSALLYSQAPKAPKKVEAKKD